MVSNEWGLVGSVQIDFFPMKFPFPPFLSELGPLYSRRGAETHTIGLRFDVRVALLSEVQWTRLFEETPREMPSPEAARVCKGEVVEPRALSGHGQLDKLDRQNIGNELEVPILGTSLSSVRLSL